MHVEAKSVEAAERRRKKTDDLQKRDRYRKAHGIEDTQNVWGFGRRLEKVKEKGDGEEGSSVAAQKDVGVQAEEIRGEGENAVGKRGEYVDFEGRRRRHIKKWFGIW